MPGNRYATAMDPQMAAQPSGTPQDASQGAPPPEAAGDPKVALTEALSILQGHDGPIIELLDDPAKLPHVAHVFTAVQQNPAALAALARAGIGPEKMQQFAQVLQQRLGAGGSMPGSPMPGSPMPGNRYEAPMTTPDGAPPFRGTTPRSRRHGEPHVIPHWLSQ